MIDIPEIAKYSVNEKYEKDPNGETDVVEFLTEIKKLNGEIIKKNVIFLKKNDFFVNFTLFLVF